MNLHSFHCTSCSQHLVTSDSKQLARALLLGPRINCQSSVKMSKFLIYAYAMTCAVHSTNRCSCVEDYFHVRSFPWVNIVKIFFFPKFCYDPENACVKTKQHEQYKNYREHFYRIKLNFSNKIIQKKTKVVLKSIQTNHFTRYFGEEKACHYTSSDPTHIHILILSCLRFSSRTKSVTICSCTNRILKNTYLLIYTSCQ